MSRLKFTVASLLVAMACVCARAEVAVESADARVVVDEARGEYRVELTKPSWAFAGTIGGAMQSAKQSNGSDALGKFAQVTFEYAAPAKMTGSIRAYREKPIV